MKTPSLILLMLVFMFIYNSKAFSQNNIKTTEDTLACLQIIGTAVDKGAPIDGAQVTLFKENQALEWDEISTVPYHEHGFSYNLLKNSYYTIEVSKSGYITRSISVSTAMPDGVQVKNSKFIFEFDVELFKEKKEVDDYYFDFPVAIISYNKTKQTFENNERYTKHIKSRIREVIGYEK